jgi:hypothetical protein
MALKITMELASAGYFELSPNHFAWRWGAFIIKAHLGLTDEDLVEQIKENLCLHFFTGLEGFQYSAPFNPLIMVYSGNGC